MQNLLSVYFVNLYMFRAYLWPIIRRYNLMYTTIGTYYAFQMTVCCLGWVGTSSNATRTTDSHLKRIISTNCCIHTVVPPDDGPHIRPKHLEFDEIY